MSLTKSIEDILSLQTQLNYKIMPNWKIELSVGDFALAATQELSELVDHTGWKWWKTEPFNLKQIHLEVVDIFHFIVSIVLLSSNPRDLLVQLESDIARHDRVTPNYSLIDCIGEMRLVLSAQNIVIDDIILWFSILCVKCKVGWNLLYDLYFGKNLLNNFRQDHGYFEGHYRKIWGTQEDNEVLYDLITSQGYVGLDLYKSLEDKYKDAISFKTLNDQVKKLENEVCFAALNEYQSVDKAARVVRISRDRMQKIKDRIGWIKNKQARSV